MEGVYFECVPNTIVLLEFHNNVFLIHLVAFVCRSQNFNFTEQYPSSTGTGALDPPPTTPTVASVDVRGGFELAVVI